MVVTGSNDKIATVVEPTEQLNNNEQEDINNKQLTLSPDQTPLYILTGHTNTVSCVDACMINDSMLMCVTGSWDQTCMIWINGVHTMTLNGHNAAVWGVLIVAHPQNQSQPGMYITYILNMYVYNTKKNSLPATTGIYTSYNKP